jgi:ferric iron reductase protein FhuF
VSVALRRPSGARATPRSAAPKPVSGWVLADQLLAGETTLRAWTAAYGSVLGAPTTAVAAALALKAYAYAVLEPAVTGWIRHRRVLDLGAAHTYVRPGGQSLEVLPALTLYTVLPGDPLTGQQGVTVVSGEDELLAALRRTLVDGHLALAVEAFRAIRGGRARPLWGSVAQSLCYPATIAEGNDRHADVRALLSMLDPAIAALVEVAEVDDGPVLLRRTCCYAYTLPSGELCRSCCLHDEQGQDQAFRDVGQTLRRITPLDLPPAGSSR